MVQGVGGGVLVPVATAAASHLFEGHDRPRALGVIGALTFLGMAAGPFVGAAILGGVHVEGTVERLGLEGGTLAAALAPAWRWIFYVNVPIGIVAIAAGLGRLRRLGDAAPTRPRGRHRRLAVHDRPRERADRADAPGERRHRGLAVDPAVISAVLFAIAAVATVLTILRDLRQETPFLEVRLFRSVSFSSAALVSLLTGYAFATAIIGGAVFVDRVLYGGPDDQRLALGALAGLTAVGALVSGFAVRLLSLRLVTLVGLVASAGALLAMSTWTASVEIEQVALALGVFGFGFGLTVTPRSTAAVESAGRQSFGIASAVVTVSRMIGMAIGLAILTAYGSTTIDRLYDQLYATPEAYQTIIPEDLRDRPLRDPFVVEALEDWASREAAGIMVGLFVVAAGVTIAAIPPGLALGSRRRRLEVEEATAAPPSGEAAAGSPPGGTREGIERGEPTVVL